MASSASLDDLEPFAELAVDATDCQGEPPTAELTSTQSMEYHDNALIMTKFMTGSPRKTLVKRTVSENAIFVPGSDAPDGHVTAQTLSSFLTWYLFYDIVAPNLIPAEIYASIPRDDLQKWVELGRHVRQFTDSPLPIITVLCSRLNVDTKRVWQILTKFANPTEMELTEIAQCVKAARIQRIDEDKQGLDNIRAKLLVDQRMLKSLQKTSGLKHLRGQILAQINEYLTMTNAVGILGLRGADLNRQPFGKLQQQRSLPSDLYTTKPQTKHGTQSTGVQCDVYVEQLAEIDILKQQLAAAAGQILLLQMKGDGHLADSPANGSIIDSYSTVCSRPLPPLPVLPRRTDSLNSTQKHHEIGNIRTTNSTPTPMGPRRNENVMEETLDAAAARLSPRKSHRHTIDDLEMFDESEDTVHEEAPDLICEERLSDTATERFPELLPIPPYLHEMLKARFGADCAF